jgi:hypothetical protein
LNQQSEFAARYRVHGADARTGVDRVIEIKAQSIADAEELAISQGLLVASVDPIGEPAPAPPMAIDIRDPGPPRCPSCARTTFEPATIRVFGRGSSICGLVSRIVGALVFLLALLLIAGALAAVDRSIGTQVAGLTTGISLAFAAWCMLAVGYYLDAPKHVIKCSCCSAVICERVG